ncbi:cell division-specific peptidoglycan biosynthesis regulator FtsW [Micromonospora yangpuensis]|uniref:Probable peptidoglycan glycosyltransferase FtsW n=1 Tax=Micromonospora yangpuensis TaxID=683228 RepID=A0A1C6UZX3_9ACTN|nr:putative peptidoglycan glycosyltransferase FtsW [Micromonospora yangpuensis]SCL59559.1 cell division-specific peptidoglycan biosynthesis regulator FtsW [Micromonospora yangpuensis]
MGPLAALRGLLSRPLASYYLLISSAGLLLVIGLTMVFSATSVTEYATGGNAFAALSKQALFAVIGIVAFWACQRLPARTYRALGRPALAVAVGLLVLLNLLLVVARLTGQESASFGPLEARLLWLFIGGFQVQPSELAKFALVLWGAHVIARKGAALGWWRELATPLFPVVALLFVLVGYNDVGTMLILLAVVVGLLWAAGVRARVFAVLSVVGLAGIGLLIAAASLGAGSGERGETNYRLARLTYFISPPDECFEGYCYQIGQGRNAIDNGGWFGVGLGKSVLKWDWLPEARNDFIFAIVAEELGVVGCAVILGLFAVLAYTGLRIARRVDDPFRRLAAAAATTWLVSQAVINIGGVVGLLPITGVPLPFISEGGSALVVTLAAIGMLASFARAEPDAARALHARPTARWVRLLWAPLPPLPGGRRRPATPPAARGSVPRSRARREDRPGRAARRPADPEGRRGGD